MSEKSFLDRAAEVAYQELERVGSDPSKLDVPQRTVAILYSLQAIIDNGGFQYLFENDLPYLLPYAEVSDAYRRIGNAGRRTVGQSRFYVSVRDPGSPSGEETQIYGVTRRT